MGFADTFIQANSLEARKELWFLDKCPLSHSLYYWSQLSPIHFTTFWSCFGTRMWQGLNRAGGCTVLAQHCKGTQPWHPPPAPLASKINTLSSLHLCLDFKHSFSIPNVNTSQDYHLRFLQMDVCFRKQVEEQRTAGVSSQLPAICRMGACLRSMRLCFCVEKPVVITSSSPVR